MRTGVLSDTARPTAGSCRWRGYGRPRAKVKVGDKIEHIDKDRALMRRLFDLGLQGNVPVPIPMKPPVYNGMIAPRDSGMMPPPL